MAPRPGRQRVQIIKRDAEKGGVLKLGTEIVSAKDGTIAALLGASRVPRRRPRSC